MLIAKLKASVLEISGCNDLDCTSDIVDRADVSLRADADCVIDENDQEIVNLEARAQSIRDSGVVVSKDCDLIIDEMRNLTLEVRQKVDCIVDDLLVDARAAISATDASIKAKEIICQWWDDAVSCCDDVCIENLEAALQQARIDDVNCILDLLSSIRVDIRAKINRASVEINAIVLDAKCRSRDLTNAALACLENCQNQK